MPDAHLSRTSKAPGAPYATAMVEADAVTRAALERLENRRKQDRRSMHGTPSGGHTEIELRRGNGTVERRVYAVSPRVEGWR